MSANDLNGGREPLFLETIPGQASQLTLADGTRLGSPVTATSTPDGGLEFIDPRTGRYFRPPANVAPQMTAVVCGNSIAAQCRRDPGGYWLLKSEIHHANALAGAPLRFRRMTATTRADSWGVYGHSGQTIPTILGDMDAQWMTPLATAGIVPDIVIGHALAENDIAQGRTTAQIIASITQWLRTVQARWPGAIVHLVTPRPSFSYNTPAIVAVYRQVRDFMLSLDDGASIFVSRGDVYENPAAPGTPRGTSGAPIYTDSSVHPNARGALLLARAQAATYRRIARTWKGPYSLSTNYALSGSAAATGTNVAGTVPIGVTVNGSANGTYITAADDPSFSLSITAGAAGSSVPLDLSTLNVGALTLSGPTQISPFAVIQLGAGAENLRSIELAPRVADGGGNTFQYFVQQQTGDAEPDYQPGDVLTIVCPPLVASSGSITACTNYVRTVTKLAGGAVSWTMRSQGVQIVA